MLTIQYIILKILRFSRISIFVNTGHTLGHQRGERPMEIFIGAESEGYVYWVIFTLYGF